METRALVHPSWEKVHKLNMGFSFPQTGRGWFEGWVGIINFLMYGIR